MPSFVRRFDFTRDDNGNLFASRKLVGIGNLSSLNGSAAGDNTGVKRNAASSECQITESLIDR